MTITTIKRSLSLVILLIFSIAGFAQEKDFGIWYGISASHDLTKKLDIELSGCLRTYNNARKLEQGFLEAGLNYKFNDYLSAAASYRLTDNIEDDSKYHLQHKAFVDLKGSLDLANLTVTGRFRFQTRINTFFEEVDDKYPEYTSRFRLKLIYKTQSFPVNPYAYGELFCEMFNDADRIVRKKRAAAGIELKVIKRHSVEFEYIFQRDYRPDISDENIISINYNLKF